MNMPEAFGGSQPSPFKRQFVTNSRDPRAYAATFAVPQRCAALEAGQAG
jgi:hypothetical protein